MKRILIIIFLIFPILTGILFSRSIASDKDVDTVLSSAEAIFRMMKERNYSGIWFFLSNTSRDAIIHDTYTNMMNYTKLKGKGMTGSKEKVREDFSSGGPVARAYWESYLEEFNPDMVLEQSRWEIGKIGKERAQINIMYKKAEKPAVIHMYKESGMWRVGLTETFRSARR